MSRHDQRGDTTRSPARAPYQLAALGEVPPSTWMILALSLLITIGAYMASHHHGEQRAKDLFLAHSRDIRAAIAKRMVDYELVLRGAAGLFSASDSVNRAEWRQYVEALRIEQNVPGLQGIGYSAIVRREERDVHIAEVRAQGFPNYTIWPDSERESYTPVLFVEPFAGRNDRALGFDMSTDPDRLEAMQLARASGQPAVTRRIFLLQERDKVGIQLYLPVYGKGMPQATPQERLAAHIGYVFAPFLMTDLMSGTFGAAVPAEAHFRIYDGPVGSPRSLLYDSAQGAGAGASRNSEAPFDAAQVETVAFGGRQWTIELMPQAAALAIADSQPLLIAASGGIISVLLFLTLAGHATRERQAEALARSMTEDLRLAASQTQAIVNSVLDGIVSVDGSGCIITFNPAAEAMFGYLAREVAGKPFETLLEELPGSDAPPAGPLAFAGRGSAQAGRRCEAVGMHKSGTRFPIELSANRIVTAGRTLYVVTVRDISEVKRIQRMQDEFVSVVSHELRTPLTSMVGALDMLSSGALRAFPDKAAIMIETAANNARRLGRLVGDIIDVERLRLGRMQLQIEPADMVEICSQALAECQPDSDRFGIQFRLQSAGSAPTLADKIRMAQVMTGLLSNAAKFSSPGAAVVVSVTRRGGKVRVAVTDRGPGIPRHLHEHIFESFFQIDRSDRRSNTGAGLGLSIAKAIVEQHGGRIGVESAPGEGATFFFELNEVGADVQPLPASRALVVDPRASSAAA